MDVQELVHANRRGIYSATLRERGVFSIVTGVAMRHYLRDLRNKRSLVRDGELTLEQIETLSTNQLPLEAEMAIGPQSE